MSKFDSWDQVTGLSKRNKFQEWDQITGIGNKNETENDPNSYSYGERALQGVRGIASGIGGSLEAAAGDVTAPSMDNPFGDPRPKKDVKGFLTAPIDKLAGRDLSPQEGDLTGKIIHGAGEIMSPLPGGGYGNAIKSGAKGLGKFLGKEAVTSLGASTAIEAKPKFSDEGTVGRGIENFADMILGSRAAGKLTGKSAQIASDLYKTTKEGNLGKSLKEYPVKKAAQITAKFSSPDGQTLKLAKEYGIDLPVNVGARNTALNWLHNNFLKSVFSAKSYKEVYNKADEQMFNKVKESIDTLGMENIEPSKASAQYRDFLKEEKMAVKQEAEKLYSDVAIKSGKSNTVSPKNTVKDLHEMSSLLDRDIQSPETLKVSKVVGKLADSWGLFPKDDEVVNILRKEGYSDPKILSQVLSQLPAKFTEEPFLEVGRLNEVRQELGKMIDFDPEVRGMKGYLRSLRNSVTKDIESSADTKFVEKWKKANKFYYDNVASRVESDLAHSMLTGEAPKEAFDAMNSVKGIKQVEKISGQTEKGKKVFSNLKKARVRDIFKNAIDGSYEDGKIRKAAFSKIFQKGEKGQEVLQELLGKEEYNKLSDIAKISEEFSNSGKELLNTSGTALVGADLDRFKDAGLSALKLILGSAGGGYSVAGGVGALGGAAASMAAPYLLSKLVSNPIFVRESRKYALLRQAGKERHAKTTLNKLIKMSESEARKSANVLNRELSKEDQEE